MVSLDAFSELTGQLKDANPAPAKSKAKRKTENDAEKTRKKVKLEKQ